MKTLGKGMIFGIGALIGVTLLCGGLVFMGMLGSSGSKSTTGTLGSGSISDTVKSGETKGMTMATYDAIKTGMTLDEVIAVAPNTPCKELSSSEVANIKTVMVQCEGAEFASNAMLTFQNGKVTSKAQFGLK